MRIEDEIKQARFKNEYEKLGINLAFTQAHLNNLFMQAFKGIKTTQEQFNVLRILQGSHPKPMGVKDIQSRMINKMSNTSRLIDKLKDNGYVERVECEHDRRAVDISLTKAGLEHTAVLSEKIEPLHKSLQTLSQAEAEQLNSLLNKLRG